MEHKITIIFSRLASDKLLHMVGNLFEIRLYTTSIIVRECCEAINIHLIYFFNKPALVWMKQIAKGFETFYNIQFILRAIDDHHNLILESSYNFI